MLQLTSPSLRSGLAAEHVVVRQTKPMAIVAHWIRLGRRPDWSVGLDARAGRDSLTPREIRDRFLSEHESTVVWADPRTSTVGAISEHGEVAWSVAPGDSLELYFRRPAKGSGDIELLLCNGARQRRLAFAARYSDAYLAWLDGLGRALAVSSPTRFWSHDEGYDT